MSRTDSRTTTRDIRLANARKRADPNAERGRKDWGGLRWFRVLKRHENRVRRYRDRKETERELNL